MCQNETDSVRLRKWQHGDVHFHGGAVGGVDVKSALWKHDTQFAPIYRNMLSNVATQTSVCASHFFGPVGGRLCVTEAVLRLLQPLPFGPLVKSNHRLHCPVCRGSKKCQVSRFG